MDNQEIELQKSLIRAEVRQKLGRLDNLVFLGPVKFAADGGVECGVRVESIERAKLPERAQIKLLGNNLEIALRIEEGPRIGPFICPGEIAGSVEVPTAGSEKDIRGGDACWPNGNSDEYGTIGIVAQELRIRASAANSLTRNNACLSAGHVFGQNPNPGDPLSTPGFASSMTFVGKLALDPTNTNPNIDAGLAEVTDPDNYASGRIRGFKKFRTNLVSSPVEGWITAVGAKSGVTIGFDRGSIDYERNGYVHLGHRLATPGVSCCHDSGAPVMDLAGNLVGMVVGGEILECRFRPFTVYIPFRRWNTPGNPLLTHDLELRITN